MDQNTLHSLKENRVHGDDSFPLAAYWITQEGGGGGPILDCHWHAEAEFYYVLDGEVLFQVDTDYFVVRAGEAVFIDGGDIHAGHSHADASCTYCAIVFDTHMLASASYDVIQQKYIALLQEKKRTFPRHIKPNSEWERKLLDHLQSMMQAYEKQSAGYEAAIKGHFYLMLSELAPEARACNRSETSSVDTTKIERLKTVILYMQQHFHRPLRITELAEQIPMSEGQFCRFFKKMTRQTPIEYLNAYRIRQAAEMLRVSDRKIAAIALDVGFDHISYFIKVFRKTMQCTPSQFRQNMKL